MKIPEGWKLVPVEPTRKMIRAGAYAGTDTFNASPADTYVAMLEAAPTPPAQEDEPVAVIDESDDGKFADLTIEGTFLKRGTRLYTRPNSGLRKAAEEAYVQMSICGALGEDEYERALRNLRAALEGR